MKDQSYIKLHSIPQGFEFDILFTPCRVFGNTLIADVTNLTYVLEYGHSGQNADDCRVVGSSRLCCFEGCSHC
jgi:hypothetical protein